MLLSQAGFLFTNRKGFSLIELMIVVAIISILATIAIPQFTAYRIRGFNASALSDLKNTVNLETFMFAGFQSFGVSNGPVPSPLGVPVYAGSGGGIGGIVSSPPAVGMTNTLTWTNVMMNLGVPLGLGNSVSIIASTELAALPATTLTSYAIIAKHLNGNTYYGAESEISTIFQDQLNGSDGTPLLPADAIASTIANSDFALPITGPSGNGWLVK
jgi:type IV pilus assembly protein PilA